MTNETVKFDLVGKPVSWSFIHNLDEFHLSLEAAFINWSVRTEKYTKQSFIEYVKSKDPINIVIRSTPTL